MAVKGVFASDNNIQGNRKGDFASALIVTQPTGNAPLFALSSGMPTKDAADTIVTWFEENHLSGRVQVTSTGNVDAAAVSLVLQDASFITAGVFLLVEATGEYVYVDAVVNNTLTIRRGFAGTTANVIANSGYLQRIGTAFEEGSNRPTGVANLGFPRYNFTQIFRNGWDVTGTARVVETYTGDVVAKNRADCGLFHAEDIERALWFSRKSLGTQNNKPFHTMDGVLAQITTNVFAQSTNVDVVDVNNFLQAVFSKNIRGKPNERIAFCGNEVVRVINELTFKQGANAYNIQAGVTSFGMKVMKWMTPFGDISLMTHPLFVESPLWTKDLYVLHPGAIRTRYLRRTVDDSYDRNGTRNGVDADYGVLTTELSIEYHSELTGGKYTGIDTSGTAIVNA